MAYSNWGAFVYRDGDRQRDREDVAVFDTEDAAYPSGLRIWGNLARLREAYGADAAPDYLHARHAVLGSGPVRLCGYKSYPELWLGPEGAHGVAPFRVPLPGDGGGERTASGWLALLRAPEGEDFGPEALYVGAGDDDPAEPPEGALAVYRWGFRQYDGNMVELRLREYDATGTLAATWASTCGYAHGAGFED